MFAAGTKSATDARCKALVVTPGQHLVRCHAGAGEIDPAEIGGFKVHHRHAGDCGNGVIQPAAIAVKIDHQRIEPFITAAIGRFGHGHTKPVG